jgi:hypothetical protein
LGLSVMLGSMISSSLAMAPGIIAAQGCDVADLDGPMLLAADCSPSVRYEGGNVSLPDGLWGTLR